MLFFVILLHKTLEQKHVTNKGILLSVRYETLCLFFNAQSAARPKAEA
jgi:hypothetical protein